MWPRLQAKGKKKGKERKEKPDSARNTTAEPSWPADNLADNTSRLNTHFLQGLPEIASLSLVSVALHAKEEEKWQIETELYWEPASKTLLHNVHRSARSK